MASLFIVDENDSEESGPANNFALKKLFQVMIQKAH